MIISTLARTTLSDNGNLVATDYAAKSCSHRVNIVHLQVLLGLSADQALVAEADGGGSALVFAELIAQDRHLATTPHRNPAAENTVLHAGYSRHQRQAVFGRMATGKAACIVAGASVAAGWLQMLHGGHTLLISP